MSKIKSLIIYPLDPLGAKIGGIGIFIKNFIKYAPNDFEIEWIGVTSESKYRPVGTWQDVLFEKRKIRFFPVMYVKNENIRTKVPLFLKFTINLFRYRKMFNLNDKILEFHRIEPALVFKGTKNRKFLFIHHNVRDLFTLRTESKWKKFSLLYSQLEKRIIPRMEKIFVVREDLTTYYIRKYPCLNDKVIFLPNGVDEEIFYHYSKKIKNDNKIKFLQQNNFHSEDKLILFVGRLEVQKDPMLLIDTFHYLQIKDKTIKLIIVGTGTLEKKMRRKLKKYGLKRSVSFISMLSQTEVAKLMRISDVLLLTSVSEGMPMTILEAQACGLPVISTDVGEVKRIINCGDSGEIINQRRPELIAQKVFKVLRNSRDYSISNCKERITFYRVKDLLKKAYETHYKR